MNIAKVEQLESTRIPRDQIVVGLPNALMTNDYAPLMIGFLNALNVDIITSPTTNNVIIKKAIEKAYSESCYPIKLLYGHVAYLLEQKATHVMIPNALRLGLKTGEEDQHYACPLVQAGPYLVRSGLGLRKEQLLDPVFDFSRGTDEVKESFAGIAAHLGFTYEMGILAAEVGLTEQRRFERLMQKIGRRQLKRLAERPDNIAAVLLARSYNSQDSGANLGMAQELEKLGVRVIPLDCLPLETVDVKTISDRPYWHQEWRIYAAAKFVAEHSQLFGIFVSNYGCGPNSMMEKVVKNIMGDKPMGFIEIDEHAAEAGYITRLEALVDAARGFHRAGLHLSGDIKKYARKISSSRREPETVVLIPRMADHAEVVAATMRAFGVNAQVLPESDKRSMQLGDNATSTKPCLPFTDTLGVYLRMAEDRLIPKGARVLMAGSFGPCRLGKYAHEQEKILQERGIDLPIMTTVSNNNYADLGLGPRFEIAAWQAILSVDHLQRMLWQTRPYEKEAGKTKKAYDYYMAQLSAVAQRRMPFAPLMREAAATFNDIKDHTLPPRPKVGINGEIYLRANSFCNNDLVVVCEANGLEVEVAPMSEWLKYVTLRNLEDSLADWNAGRLLRGGIRKIVLDYYERKVYSWVKNAIREMEPSTHTLLQTSAPVLPRRCGSEAVISSGSGIRQMEDPHFAGVISVMPHGCMPGGIVAALAEQISREYGNKPWISLTYNGFEDKVNPERIANLAELLRHVVNNGTRKSEAILLIS